MGLQASFQYIGFTKESLCHRIDLRHPPLAIRGHGCSGTFHFASVLLFGLYPALFQLLVRQKDPHAHLQDRFEATVGISKSLESMQTGMNSINLPQD